MPKKVSAIHPGEYVKNNVIPKGLTVTEAAKKMGLGRPALSNFLNGKASLSAEMAARLEKCFNVDKAKLLDLQKILDESAESQSKVLSTVRKHVPNFLTIKAIQIEQWAETTLEARTHLSVLIRRLICSTSSDLKKIDFPGFDNAERRGWDGYLEASLGNPWVPEGKSGWEFGVNKDPQSKASSDYDARVKKIPSNERSKMTFVFVTPRNWKNKTEWVISKKALNEWMDVKVFDASDLEQWLEQSISAQAWFSEKLGMSCDGYSTLDKCWENWSMVTTPPLIPEIFEPSITNAKDFFISWLSKEAEKPLVITADSREEALAFLACLINIPEMPVRIAKESCVVLETDELIRKYDNDFLPFIPIARTDSAARALATHCGKKHCIIVRPRNSQVIKSDIDLVRHNHSTFEKALNLMGIESGEIRRLARESGRFPTILRRRLAKVDALRIPDWAKNSRLSFNLIPLLLIGLWNTESKADLEIISTFTGDSSTAQIEEKFTELLNLEDSPVWSNGKYRGIASKIDSIFAVSEFITKDHLMNFLWLAEFVMSEKDPSLELPEDKKWAASLYGKVRDHSAGLRESVCDTLVLLSVYGNSLFKNRLGNDVENEVHRIVRSVLSPLTIEKFLTFEKELPDFAEAAPEIFLRLLETDLSKEFSATLELVKTTKPNLISWKCPRTSLLWALERLAWNSDQLLRVCEILSKLSQISLEDNWASKPENSLHAIFRWWMPQTSCSIDERVKTLQYLIRKYPDVSWRVLLSQVDQNSRIGHYNSRPHWRSDANGAGEPSTDRKNLVFRNKSVDLALAWNHHNARTLGELISLSEKFSESEKQKLWEIVEEWAKICSDDEEKAHLREDVRRIAFSKNSLYKHDKTTIKLAKKVFSDLAPTDIVLKHKWLFESEWLSSVFHEMAGSTNDYEKLSLHVHALRQKATEEIWKGGGYSAFKKLLLSVESPSTASRYMANFLTQRERSQVTVKLYSEIQDNAKFEIHLRNFFDGLKAEEVEKLLTSLSESLSKTKFLNLLLFAPFCQIAWNFLEQESELARAQYWSVVSPSWRRRESSEMSSLIANMLKANRPRAALFVISQFDWESVETLDVKKLLYEVATNFAEPDEMFKIDRHSISAAFRVLNKRNDINAKELAELEFLYIEVIDRHEYNLNNLQKQLAESAGFFVQVASTIFKDSDEENDFDHSISETKEQQKERAKVRACYKLLKHFSRIPGYNSDGEIEKDTLLRWVKEVRNSFSNLRMKKIGDQLLGELFSKAKQKNLENEELEFWPDLAICEVLENIGTEELETGFRIGICNARGVFEMREDGKEEREISERYRRWSNRIKFDYPFVSRILLSTSQMHEKEAEWQISEWKARRRLLD